MTIAKSTLIASCNKAWQTSEDTSTSTLFDEAIQMALDDLSVFPILRAQNLYPVTAVNTGTKTFTIAGNHAATITAGSTIRIDGSTGNDGFYTVTSATDVSTNTQIVVDETVADATADGDLYSRCLIANGYEIDFPEGFQPGGLISLSLMDSNGNAYAPLRYFKRGLREYRQMLRRDSGASQPEYFVEGEDQNWLVWPTANASYSVRVEYYRSHPQSVGTILFPDSCVLALKCGTIFYEAAVRRNVEYQGTWGPLYEREKRKLNSMYPGDPLGAY